jgi:hypothetical protein
MVINAVIVPEETKSLSIAAIIVGVVLVVIVSAEAEVIIIAVVPAGIKPAEEATNNVVVVPDSDHNLQM